MKRLFWLAALIGFCSPAITAQPILKPNPEVHALPAGLIEISGLAKGPGQTVYSHNDEHGIVYVLNIESGDIEAAFALGNPTVERDFEGIAQYDDRIYMISSHGYLYEAPIGAHQSRVKFNVYDTGIGDICEVEGLSSLGTGEFLIICKKARNPAYEDRLLIFKWSLERRSAVSEPFINLQTESWLEPAQRRRFQPSAIEVLPDGNMMILSARSRTVFLLDPEGGLINYQILPKNKHKQAEGLAIMPGGEIVIADEGKGGTPGKISIYQPSGTLR